jgi:hypothetical protein
MTLNQNDLEPLTEVEGALLVVEVLHLPHPKLLGLLASREHFSAESKTKPLAFHTKHGIH